MLPRTSRGSSRSYSENTSRFPGRLLRFRCAPQSVSSGGCGFRPLLRLFLFRQVRCLVRSTFCTLTSRPLLLSSGICTSYPFFCFSPYVVGCSCLFLVVGCRRSRRRAPHLMHSLYQFSFTIASFFYQLVTLFSNHHHIGDANNMIDHATPRTTHRNA